MPDRDSQPTFPTTEQIDTSNRFIVGARGNHLIVMNPPTRMTELTPDEALVLAAWLVAMAEFRASVPFATVLEKVQNS